MDAERDVLKLLHYVEETAPNLNKKYPRTFWASMKVCVGSMPEEAQKLLLLAAMCEGPSVPEEVLRIMCESTKLLRGAAFNKLRNDLEQKSLVVIDTQVLPWADAISQLTQRRWSLHRLQKQFLRHEMSQEAEAFADMFLGESGDDADMLDTEDAKLFKVLCALYFEKSLAKRAAAKWGISFRNFSERRRLAIEPLEWLIQNHSDQSSYHLARKVLLEYVCNEQAEDNDIARLLRLPRSAAATCWALETMWWITEKSMVSDGEKSIISALVHLLGEGIDRNSREKALRVLVNLAAKATASQRIRLATYPGLMDGIVNVLNRFQTEAEVVNLYKQQELATRIFNFLASEEENKARIVDFPFALDVLVRCILKDDAVASPELQEDASVTLAIVARANATQTKRKIIEFPGVLGGLVKLLNKDEAPHAQQCAASALAYLSVNVGEHNNRRVAQYPYALSGLVNLLFKDQSPVSQMWAAWALTNLSVEEKNRREIVEFPYALPRFVRLLGKDESPDVQKWCASALAMLALDEQCNRKIADFPDALAGLVNLLYKEKALQVQTWAAWALSNLSADPQTMAQISKFPDAVRRIKELTLQP
ncbi:hypothetical protein Mapa_014014 [Marchantia paleacea]|nr:hypothetical protein Mapa_014014 [Marchantia paleacea]